MTSQRDRGDEQRAIGIAGVNYWFGSGETRMQVLYDNHLEIGRGEIVILTGPSGSGKTTLLTLVGALRRVQEGSVRVLDSELAGMGPASQVALRREIGFIFQHHNLFTSLSAVENVRMATALRPAATAEMHRRARDLLERLGLKERMHALPGRLSGGQRQRVAIARALVNEPKLVLADEPTAALDAGSGQEVLNLLHELADGPNRSTVLIVTHDQRVLNRADRIVNLVGGRIVSNVMPAVTLRIVKTLREVEALAGLNTSTLTACADHMIVAIVPPGTVLSREGEPGDRFFVIGRGEAEQVHDGEIVRTLGEGCHFGQITSVFPFPVPVTTRARTELELFVMTEPNLRRVIALDKSIDERVKVELMHRQ